MKNEMKILLYILLMFSNALYAEGRYYENVNLQKLNYNQNIPYYDGNLSKYIDSYNDYCDYNVDTMDTQRTPNYDDLYDTNEWNCYFYINQKMDVTFSHCGSDVLDTYIEVKGEYNGITYISADGASDVGGCADNSDQPEFTVTLPAGSYKVISQGYFYNGNIKLWIHTTRNETADDVIDGKANPIDLGILDNSFQIKKTVDNSNYRNTYGGVTDKRAGDVWHRFTVKKNIKKIFLHNNPKNTWFAILNENKQLLYASPRYYDSSSPEIGQGLNLTLNSGIYYLVSSTVNNEEGEINIEIKDPDLIVSPTFASGINYVVTKEMKQSVSDIQTINSSNSNTTIQYFDGLGRKVETVQKGITPYGKDLVNVIDYDLLGREFRQWLPIPIDNVTGSFIDPTTHESSTISYYNYDRLACSETFFENSPLNRITGNRQAGVDWQSKPTTQSFQTNSGSEVICFSVNNNDQLVRNGFYAINTIYKTITTDEDGKTAIKYQDKQGNVVMKRSEEGGHVDTYYVYNDLNQLSFVLSPRASEDLVSMSTPLSATNDNALGKLGYAYLYDARGNCIWKKLPGCEPIYMVYDQANRLVLSQDGNQRVIVDGKNQWAVTKYDGLGRVISTGITKNIATTKTLINLVDEYKIQLITETYTNNSGYSNIIFSDASTLIVNYYDTYNYQLLPDYSTIKAYLTYGYLSGFGIQYSSAKGLLTGTAVAMLDGSATLVTAKYYDDRGRVVQTKANNRLSGYDYEYYSYNFTGQPIKKQHVHKTSYIASELTENYRFTYDNANRLTGEYHQLNTQNEVTLATMTYDELGRMDKKVLNGGGETIDYTYNIRNWTKTITSPRFAETMYYQDALDSKPVCYNGNISAVKWGIGSIQDKKYYYTYDGLNRMKKATYWPDETFNEEITQYDKNGNILGLNRNGYVHDWESEFPVYTGSVDELGFEYNGNQMRNVWDNLCDQDILNATTNDFRNGYDENLTDYYLYDANGNQYADLNKSIAWIRYNFLNLPSKIQFINGNKNVYLYDASGTKHRATYGYTIFPVQVPLGVTAAENPESNITQSNYTDYCGNYVYENGILKRILTPEGYVTIANSLTNSSLWNYTYLLKDHLGNTRQILNGNFIGAKSPTLTSSNSTIDYYPFGMEIMHMDTYAGYASGNLPGTATPYLYNGKEMDRMNGLNSYDYGARWRDGVIPSWQNVDPLCEKYYSVSPYVYCLDNPVRLVDPDGRTPRIYVETQKFGHAFVTVGEGKNTVVYTYGRYGSVDKDKSSGRDWSPTGDGVLVRLKGKEAMNFIQNEVKDKGAKIYEITNGDDKKVSKYFDSAFNSSDKKPTEKSYKDSENARVIDQYDISNNNCTTKSVEAVKAGTDGNFKIESTTPDGLETKLQYQSQDQNSNVKQIPYKTVIDENNKK